MRTRSPRGPVHRPPSARVEAASQVRENCARHAARDACAAVEALLARSGARPKIDRARRFLAQLDDEEADLEPELRAAVISVAGGASRARLLAKLPPRRSEPAEVVFPPAPRVPSRVAADAETYLLRGRLGAAAAAAFLEAAYALDDVRHAYDAARTAHRRACERLEVARCASNALGPQDALMAKRRRDSARDESLLDDARALRLRGLAMRAARRGTCLDARRGKAKKRARYELTHLDARRGKSQAPRRRRRRSDHSMARLKESRPATWIRSATGRP